MHSRDALLTRSHRSENDLAGIQGITIKEGVLCIEPDTLGAGGKVVKEISGDQVAQKLSEAMRETLKSHVRMTKTRRDLAARGL